MISFEEKDNVRSDVQQISSNGSLPKRYQSVFTESTPLTSLGIGNDVQHHRRSHSVTFEVFVIFQFECSFQPPNHIQPQIHQRPLRPVREFLIVDEQQS